MNLFALLLICFGLCNAFEDKCQGDYLKSVYEKCLASHGGNRVVIDDLLESRKSSNEDGKCFRACLLQECQYLGDDGKLNGDVPIRLAGILHGGDESHMKPVEEAGAKCVELQTYDDSICDMAEKFMRCLVEQSTVTLKLYGLSFDE